MLEDALCQWRILRSLTRVTSVIVNQNLQGDNVKDPEILVILIHVKIMVSVSWMISEDLYVNVRMVILEDYAKKC